MPLNFVAKAAITVGLTAANMALTMSRKIEGPRLDNLKFTSGDYGQPLPMVWGIRRMEVPIFWAEDLREVKRRRKTKGGKFNEYTYFGTWAVALAGHEIEAVRRIWFDTHLAYDMSGTGPVTPFDFGASGDINDAIAIYLGTSTQDPDPRMQATVEAEFGEGSCAAYRDTAYIVFKDIPLEKIGNRIPQVSVEILGAVGAIYPTETLDVDATVTGLTFSSDYSTLSMASQWERSIVDVASRQKLLTTTLIPAEDDIGISLGYLQSGNLVGAVTGSGAVYSWDLSGAGEPLFDLPGSVPVGGTVLTLTDSYGVEHWFAAHGTDAAFYFDGQPGGDADTVTQCTAFTTSDGEVWAIGRPDEFDLTGCVLMQIQGGALTHTVTLSNSEDNAPIAFHYRDDTVDHFVVAHGSHVYTISREDGTITNTYEVDYPLGTTLMAFRAVAPDSATFWCGFEEISSVDLSRVRLLNRDDWDGSSQTHAVTIYDPINHALIGQFGDALRWYYLDRIAPAGVLLSTIAGDIANMCGIETYDFSDLDQEVTGWSATRGQGSAMLEPLLDAYDSDFRPHDFGIEGLKRTGATTGSTLLTERFVGEHRYSVSIRAELPRAVLFDFADIYADQQPNSVRSDRPLDATSARGEQKIDLTTLALDPDEARQLGNRYFRRLWNERKQVSLSLTAQELKLEPGDVRTLDLDDDTFAARCVRTVVKADDTIETEWRYDAPTLATLDGSAGAPFDGRDPSVVVVPVLSKGFVLDIPLLSDSDDAVPPQVYSLAAPYAEGSWPGATIYQAVDGEYSEELASVASSDGATWGYVSTALPYANPNLWDRGSEITVTLQAGDLTGCTEASANADPSLNLAAIGKDGRWEIVQFSEATLTAPLTYTVSGFKRGRRGTEWAAELHEAGDQFVLLETADAQTMGLSEVGTDVSFKPITAGRTTGFAFGYTYEGQTLKPYAPVHLHAEKDVATGDWTFTWVRRTRVGGAWTSGTTIPLSEASEEYEITVGDGVTDATHTVTSPTYVWDVAQQTTDTGAEVMEGDLAWSVAQVSDAVGAGFIATA